MKVKLNREQAQRLLDFITDLLSSSPYSDRNEKILDILVNKIRIKIRNKLDAIRPNTGYSITLLEEEALAFEEWMSQISPAIPKLSYVYEKNEAKKITNQINATYGY